MKGTPVPVQSVGRVDTSPCVKAANAPQHHSACLMYIQVSEVKVISIYILFNNHKSPVSDTKQC